MKRKIKKRIYKKGFTIEKMFLLIILIVLCYFLIRLAVLNLHIGLNFPKSFHIWPKNVEFDNLKSVFPNIHASSNSTP